MSSYYGFSQQYPVQVTTTLAPPYSLYLSDYTAIGSNNLQVLVNLLELDRPNLQIKFRITIEGAGITLRTNPAFMPRPLNIQGGVPELFTGADITSYFNPDHLDFTGITRAAFKRSGQLPEGFYTFTLEVLEYNRNVRISNQSISYAWIVLNDPPLLNTPFNGDKLIATDPQNIMFSWTPRHTASPNAAFSTEYEFRLVEMYPGQTNPDIGIRSSNSIYTTTTNLTSLNYGIIEPTLIPGKRYAFRVRAYDTSRRDLFKNDGYSESYVFQYGDACGTFEGIAAKTLDPQRARISWEPEQHHTGCVINYRKNGKDDWFTQEVNGSYGIVAQLAGQTTYEYQLTPQCGTILGEKSPVMTFTTPEVDESGFVCGAPIPEFDGSNIPLMKPLLPLDVIQVGDWTVNLLNVSANGDGTYGGAGYAAVPNFNLANVRVVFDRILVNEDYQVVAGDIKTVYSEDSRFVLDIKKKEEAPEVVEVPETVEPEPELSEDLVADVLTVSIEGDIGEVIFSGELLEIYDEFGNLIEDAALDLPPEGEELTITDSNGDTWVVDSEGGVREVQGDDSSTPESSEVDVIVQFKQTEESNYGFDAYDADIPQLRHFYQSVLTINDEDYVPAWKSVPVGMPDQVIAVANENEFPENMKFRTSTLDLEPMAGQQDNEKHLSVIGKAHGDVDVIEAYQTIEEENVAGRINVISYEKIYKTLEIVPVNGASIGDINTIGDRINRIFQQAAVEWKVEAAEPFMVDPKLLENFDEGESGMLASFPDKMQQFNREFKRSRPVDKETYYIFVINEGSASLSGFMPFKRQFGYVFTKNTNYTNKTIAHELAHGAFRLRHTFSSAYGIPQRSTDNLMDYNGDEDRLKKFQWDLIHDPENLVGWFEDDEESALDRCSWYEAIYSYLNPSNLDKKLASQLPLFREVFNNYEKYYEESKKNNIDIFGHNGWTVRKASHGKNSKGEYLVERVILKLFEENSSEVILHEKGISMGRYTIEGQEFKISVFSWNEKSSIEKVEVNQLCKLADNKVVKVFVDDDLVLINFIRNNNIELTIQINTGKEKTAELWLKYLSILVESQDLKNEIKYFWEVWLREDSEDEVCKTGFCCTKCGKDLTFNLEKFSEIFPNVFKSKNAYVEAFNLAFQEKDFEYNTCDRQAKILSQIMIETNSLQFKTEGEGKVWKITGENQLLDYFKKTAGAKKRWFNQEFWDNKIYKNFSQVGYYEKLEESDIGTSGIAKYQVASSLTYYGYYNNKKQERFKVKIPVEFKSNESGNYKRYGNPTLIEKAQIEKNIYNYAYGGSSSLGNGDHLTTNDGFDYRGRGGIQLTGKANYEALNKKLKGEPFYVTDVDIVTNPDEVANNPKIVVLSTFIHFKSQLKNNILKLDQLNIDQVSALINTGNEKGSANHEPQRKNAYLSLKKTEHFKCDE